MPSSCAHLWGSFFQQALRREGWNGGSVVGTCGLSSQCSHAHQWISNKVIIWNFAGKLERRPSHIGEYITHLLILASIPSTTSGANQWWVPLWAVMAVLVMMNCAKVTNFCKQARILPLFKSRCTTLLPWRCCILLAICNVVEEKRSGRSFISGSQRYVLHRQWQCQCIEYNEVANDSFGYQCRCDLEGTDSVSDTDQVIVSVIGKHLEILHPTFLLPLCAGPRTPSSPQNVAVITISGSETTIQWTVQAKH